MFIPATQGAFASMFPPDNAPDNPPTAQPEPVRLMAFGSLKGVQTVIRQLHQRGYAEPNDWSQPLPTGRPHEVMAILTKRIIGE